MLLRAKQSRHKGEPDARPTGHTFFVYLRIRDHITRSSVAEGPENGFPGGGEDDMGGNTGRFNKTGARREVARRGTRQVRDPVPETSGSGSATGFYARLVISVGKITKY